MSDLLAYQIGAVFFLVVLFMAGTMTRGVFSGAFFKNIKVTVFVLVLLALGILAYHNLPDLSSIFNFDSDKPAAAAAQTPAAGPVPAAVPARRSASPRAAVAPVGEVRIIRPLDDEPDPVPIPVAQAADTPQPPITQPVVAAPRREITVRSRVEPAQESENRVKRAIESVGGIFRGRNKKYQPKESVPVDASAP